MSAIRIAIQWRLRERESQLKMNAESSLYTAHDGFSNKPSIVPHTPRATLYGNLFLLFDPFHTEFSSTPIDITTLFSSLRENQRMPALPGWSPLPGTVWARPNPRLTSRGLPREQQQQPQCKHATSRVKSGLGLCFSGRRSRRVEWVYVRRADEVGLMVAQERASLGSAPVITGRGGLMYKR